MMHYNEVVREVGFAKQGLHVQPMQPYINTTYIVDLSIILHICYTLHVSLFLFS